MKFFLEIFGNCDLMIPMIIFFDAVALFSFHNFQILLIKFLANWKIPLLFKCNPLLLR